MVTSQAATETTTAVKPVAVAPAPSKAANVVTVTKPAPAKRAAKSAAKAVVKPVATPKAAAKAPIKASPKPAVKTAVKTSEKAVASAALKGKMAKDVKAKKPKLVRDSFTIPKAEYTVLDDLKQRAGKLSNVVKKSELIRAGVKALAAMSDAAFLSALKAVPAIKTGRPSKTKA